MKTKISIAFILLAFIMSSSSIAQTKKKKKEKETIKYEAPTVVTEEVIDMVVAEDMSTSRTISEANNFEPISSIQYNNKYEIYEGINDQYDFYCEKYSKYKSNNLGIVDKSGNVILPHLFSKSYSNSNKNDVLLYMNNNYGLFNLKELRWSIPMDYEDLNLLGNSLFSARKNGVWGVIDNNNNVIVPFEWSQINTISSLENYIIVTSNTYPNKLKGVYSLVEHKLTVPCIYTSLDKIDRQNSFLVNNGSANNIVDINNTPRFKQWYDNINIPSNGRLFYIVKKENRYGVIDDNEKEVIPISYSEFAQYPYSDGSYLARNKDGKYGFILIDGRVTLPFEYDNLKRNYNDNVVSVQNGKCGLVQVNSGVPYEIVTCNYDDIKGGRKTFIVEKGGKFGLLDTYGKSLTAIEYQSLVALEENSNDDILFKARKNDTCQLINEQGKTVGDNTFLDFSILPKKSSSSYYYGTKYTYLKAKVKNGKYCIIDKVGKSVSKSMFDDVDAENDNVFIVKSNNKYGLYSLLDQKLIVDFKYDLIIKTNDNYFGFTGKKIDFLVVKSGDVTKISTTK